jgi:hypothetical protein
MIIASSIALFFVPMFFYLIENSGERLAAAKDKGPKVSAEPLPDLPRSG